MRVQNLLKLKGWHSLRLLLAACLSAKESPTWLSVDDAEQLWVIAARRNGVHLTMLSGRQCWPMVFGNQAPLFLHNQF